MVNVRPLRRFNPLFVSSFIGIALIASVLIFMQFRDEHPPLSETATDSVVEPTLTNIIPATNTQSMTSSIVTATAEIGITSLPETPVLTPAPVAYLVHSVDWIAFCVDGGFAEGGVRIEIGFNEIYVPDTDITDRAECFCLIRTDRSGGPGGNIADNRCTDENTEEVRSGNSGWTNQNIVISELNSTNTWECSLVSENCQ